MFTHIKKCIDCLPQYTFSEYYKNYVQRTQDELIFKEMNSVRSALLSSSDLMLLESSINKLVEEMQ